MSGLGSGAGDSGVVGGGSAAPNLVSEFEASYQSILATLTQEDFLFTKQEEDKIGQFMDIARQIETFFLQKRLLIHNYKPELILKEDSSELKQELSKKDELIRRHYDKLAQWQMLLQDKQGGAGAQPAPAGALISAHGPATPGGTLPTVMGTQGAPRPGQISGPGVLGNVPGGSMLPSPGAPMQPGAGAPQGGFVPGNNYRMQMGGGPGGVGGPGGPGFGVMGGHSPSMRDPLSYLERATSRVGTPPNTGGR